MSGGETTVSDAELAALASMTYGDGGHIGCGDRVRVAGEPGTCRVIGLASVRWRVLALDAAGRRRLLAPEDVYADISRGRIE